MDTEDKPKKTRNVPSYKSAVRQFCIECMGGGEGQPLPYKDVAECSAPKCALYELRPFKGSK